MIYCKKMMRLGVAALLFTLAHWSESQAQFTMHLDVTSGSCCVNERVIVWTLDEDKVYADLPIVNGKASFDIHTVENPNKHNWRVRFSFTSCICWAFNNETKLNLPNANCGQAYSSTGGGIIEVGIGVTLTLIAPPVTAPFSVNGTALDNICETNVQLDYKKVDGELAAYQVARSASGPWYTFALNLFTTTETISKKKLNDAIGDGLNVNQFYVRMKATQLLVIFEPPPCHNDRVSPPVLVVFRNNAPSDLVVDPVSPSCQGAEDGALVITGLKDSDGTDFPTGESLRYTITDQTTNFTYNITSAALPVTINQTPAGGNVPVKAGDWQIMVEGIGNQCASSPDFIKTVSNPPALALLSAVVSQPITCTGGEGAISVAVANDHAPFTYTLTGENGFIRVASGQADRNYTFTALPPGDYQVKVQGCALPVNSNVIKLSGPSSVLQFQSLTANNASCALQSDGEIITTISGGTKPYFIQWDGGAFTELSGSGYVISGLASGNHGIVVRDVNFCSTAQNITVGINPPVSGQVASDDLHPVTCSGAANGYIILTAFGAAGTTFEYGINGVYQSSGLFVNLSAGSYSISVRDKQAPLCKWDGSVIITEPAPILINDFSVVQEVSCYGESDGAFKALASGGTPANGYGYQLLNQTTGLTLNLNSLSSVFFTDVPAGNYVLTVTDGTPNCQVTATSVLTQPDEVLLHAVLSDYNGHEVSCASSSDGTVSFSSTGGIYPHRISVAGRPDQFINSSGQTASFTDFLPGDYFFTVTSNGCEKDSMVRFTAPAPLQLSLSAQQFGDGYQVSCKGSADGLLTAQAMGGTMPYTFSIAPGGNPLSHDQVNTSTVNFSALPAGSYTVTLKDVNLCETNNIHVLTEPEELKVEKVSMPDIFGMQLRCHGDSDAIVTVFSKGGSYPHTMTLMSGAQQGISHSIAEGVTFSGLAANSYSFQIEDEEGCLVNGDFTLLQPDPVALDNSQTILEKPDCAGQQTGSLHMKAVGGIGTVYDYQITYLDDRSRLPFSYPEQQTQAGNPVDFDLLIAGTYQVFVADEVGCSHTETLVMNTNHQVAAQLTTTDITCKSDKDGSAALILQGGVAPYEVLLRYQAQTLQSHQAVNENQTISFPGLQADLYTFEVSDANGCTYYNGNYQFQIESPADALSLQASVKPITCYGDNNGTLILQAQGGWQEAAYLYSTDLTQWNSHQTIYEDLSPGIYRYFAKDNKGCIDTLDVSIHEPALLKTSVASVQNVSCFGETDGSFLLTTTGGTMPYQISMDGGNSWTASQSISELAAGNYEVSIRDSNACATTQALTVTQPALLQAFLVDQQNTLCKQSTGSATVNVVGGTAPYSLSWTDQQQQTIGDELTLQMLTAGQYTFHVHDDHACMTELPVTIINTNDIVFDVIHVTGVKCYGEANGSAELSITSIQSPYSITWDNGAATAVVSNLMAGERTVVLEDANQCQVSQSFTVPSPDALTLSDVQKTDPSCFGSCDGQLIVQASGGTGAYHYNWQGSNSVSPMVSNACAGNYQLSLRDANNCLLEQTLSLTAPAKNKLGMEDSTYYICQGQSVNISLPQWASHQWSSNTGFTSNSSTVTLTQSGDYSITAKDAAGCSSQADFKVNYSNDLLKSEFLIAKEAFAGDTVVCVAISKPVPELMLWQYDHNIAISVGQTDPYQQLVFLSAGSYEVTLVSHLGGCVAQQSKSIVIHAKSNDEQKDDLLGYQEKGIKELLVFPNPNEGEFACKVSLYEPSDIHIRLLNLYGKEIAEQQEYAIKEWHTDFSITDQPSGLYWLIVETPDDRQLFKVLVR